MSADGTILVTCLNSNLPSSSPGVDMSTNSGVDWTQITVVHGMYQISASGDGSTLVGFTNLE